MSALNASAGTGVFILSLLSIPVSYLFNHLIISSSVEFVLLGGVSVAVVVTVLVKILLKRKAPSDPLFYVYAVYALLSVVNLIIGLEQDGIIDGFVTFYLKQADPNINTAHGHMTSYWNGCAHYLMYLLMVAAITWGESYRAIGLYWMGSFLMQIIVYIPASVVGKYGSELNGLFLLHLLFVSVSVWTCFRIFNQPATWRTQQTDVESEQKCVLQRPADLIFIVGIIAAAAFGVFRGLDVESEQKCVLQRPADLIFIVGIIAAAAFGVFRGLDVESEQKCVLQRPADLIFIVGIIAAAAFGVFRGLVALDCPSGVCKEYVVNFEPYIKDPSAFPTVQMLVNMLYSTPCFVLMLYGLLVPGCDWLPDLSLVHAGAVAQAQFCHTGASLHTRTPFSYRVPSDQLLLFLTFNLLYALLPQALSYRCISRPALFTHTPHKHTL